MTDRFLAFLRVELELTPARWRAIARIVIASVIATTAVMTLQIPQGSWLVLTIFIVSMPDSGASVIRAVQRLLGTLVGAVVAITFAITFPQQPWFLLPAMASALGVGVYLSRTSATPYIPLLGTLTMVLAIGGVDITAPEGIDLALWRFLNIGAGNLIGTLCQALLWPEKPDTLLFHHLSRSLRYSAERIGQGLVSSDQVVTNPKQLAASEERVMNSLATWTTWLDNATHSGSDLREHHEEVVNLIGDVNQVAISSQQIARAASRLALDGESVGFPRKVEQRVRELQERCLRHAEVIETRVVEASLDTLPKLVPGIAIAVSDSHDADSTDSPDSHDLVRDAIASSAISVAEGLDAMTDSFDFLRPTADRRARGTPSPLFVRERQALRVPRGISIRKADVLASAKASLAAMISYIYLNAIDWPGGITAVVTAVLCSLDNYGAIIQKTTLRLVGAIIGGLLALMTILLVIPNIESLPAFLLVTSAIFGIGAWVQTGSVRISYVGLQLAYAAGLCLLDTHGPTIDLMPFRDRVLGIFVGISAIALVYAIFGEIRSRIWALDNSAQTLRLMARAASVGLAGMEPAPEDRPPQGFRYEIYRRISFGYRLLTESTYEDWFTGHREIAAREIANLRDVLDRLRGIQRLTMSILWNRIEFQRESAPEFPPRIKVEAVGRMVPRAFEIFADRLEKAGQEDSAAKEFLEEFKAVIAVARKALADDPPGPEGPEATQKLYSRLRSQLGFYLELSGLLEELENAARTLQLSEDTFSLAAWLGGSEHRTTAPSIRPV